MLGVSRPDEPSAERLHAVVVPDEDALRARGAANVRELMRFELEGQSVHLPPHKRVLSFDVWMTPLPRTTTGKLRRHEIRRLVAEQAVAAASPAVQPLSDADRAWLEDPARTAAIAAISEAVPDARVTPDANLELDLGLDSMERVELLTRLEQQAGTKVPTDVRATIFTVRQLIDAVGEPQNLRTPEPQNPGTPEPLPWQTLLAAPFDEGAVAHLDRARTIRALAFFVFIRACRMLARLLFGFRVTGAGRVPRGVPLIICPNHQSFLDGFFVAAALPFDALRRIFFVGAAEYYQTPLARWLAALGNIVPVDPDANLVAAMQASAAGLRANHVLVLFPEGERSIDGDVKTFRKGATILSSHLSLAIVPVGLDGPYALWPRSRPFNWRGLLPWRAPRVSLAFGEPMTVAPGDYAAGTAALEAGVRRLVSQLRQNGTP